MPPGRQGKSASPEGAFRASKRKLLHWVVIHLIFFAIDLQMWANLATGL
jgi:hypothetical protein